MFIARGYVYLLAVSMPCVAGQAPLHFEPNVGQFDKQVRYVSRGAGYTLLLTDTEAVMALEGGDAGDAVVRMKFAGGRPARGWEALEKQPGITNYFLGNDPAKWRTSIPNYRRVKAREIYPGVDWIAYGNQGQLEYDLAVAPGADASQVQLSWEGADSIRLNEDGDLVLATRLGEVVQKRPRVYQDGADGRRIEVAAKYELADHGRVKFELEAYDRRRPLVIDPVVLVYSTYLGGNGGDTAIGIAVDSSGSAYVTGNTSSANFPTVSPYLGTPKGAKAIYVTKFSADGKTLVYSTYIGGSGVYNAAAQGTLYDTVAGIAVDSSGSAYVTGSAISTDFPTQSPYQSKPAKNAVVSAFVTKFSPAGNTLDYSTYLGGTGSNGGAAIAVDSAGSAYVMGVTDANFFPLQNPYQGQNNSAIDTVFVTKFTPDGSALVYSTYLGGSAQDLPGGIAVDASGSAYVTGVTYSDDFPLQNAYDSSFPAGSFNEMKTFVTKFSPAGSTLVYSTYLGGNINSSSAPLASTTPLGIAVDASGSAYVAGGTGTSDFPTTAGGATSGLFLTKFSPDGKTLVYSTRSIISPSTPGTTTGLTAFTLDSSGSVYFTGNSSDPNYPIVAAYQSQLPSTSGSAVVTKFSPSGGSIVFSTFLGGPGTPPANTNPFLPTPLENSGVGIALDASGAIYITGNTYSTSFPTMSPYQPQNGGGATLGTTFVTKLSAANLAGISEIANAEGEAPVIAPNTWVEIKGSGLAPAGDSRTWASADFVGGTLPTSLDGVSVMVNNKPAYVYYISPGQINILTPADAMSGQVPVQVTNGSTVVNATAQAAAQSPSFFVFNGGPYVAATHASGALIGPTTLYPGLTTPVAPGEQFLMYGNGFGNISAPIVDGATSQSGVLSPMPVIKIGGSTASVAYAGINGIVGEFQFNVTVPAGLSDGDQPIVATYNGLTTQAGTLITVHH